jgi:hypothetical protein
MPGPLKVEIFDFGSVPGLSPSPLQTPHNVKSTKDRAEQLQELGYKIE